MGTSTGTSTIISTDTTKKELDALNAHEHCGVGAMAFDSMGLIRKRIQQGRYTDAHEAHNHMESLDNLARKVRHIADAKHHRLCADAEKVISKISEVRALLKKEYERLIADLPPAQHPHRRRYVGTGIHGISAGSAKQGASGGAY